MPLGVLTLSAARISASGAVDLAFGSTFPQSAQLVFDGDVRLYARRSIVIEAQRLAAEPATIEVDENGEETVTRQTDVSIESAYARLSGVTSTVASLASIARHNRLPVKAGLIAVLGDRKRAE